MQDDIIFSTGFTDVNGKITLNWETIEEGDMHITVIKPSMTIIMF